MSDYPKTPRALVELSNGARVEIEAFNGSHYILDDVVPNALADIGAFLRSLGVELFAYMDASGGIPLARIPVERVLRECRKPVVALLRAAVVRPDEWWAGLDLGDLLLLASAVFQVNQERHGKKLMAALATLFGNQTTPTA